MIKLTEHQKRVKDRFEFRSGLLAHEMGTGKTIASIYTHIGKDKILVVCKASLVNNFAVELSKMGENDVEIVKTGKHTISGSKWLITSYGLLGKIINQVEGIYKTMIVDESHCIKGKTLQAKTVIRIAHTCDYVLLLTGTPITNKPIDYWNQLVAIRAGITKAMNRTKFSKRYCGGHLKNFGYRFMWWEGGAKNLDELKNMVKADVDIVKKTEVLDLPPKNIVRNVITMNTDQKRDYTNAWNTYIEWLHSNPEFSLDNIQSIKNSRHLVELGKLRQVTSKIKARDFLENIEDLGEQQAIIFTYYVETLEIINKGLEKLNIKYSTLKQSGSVEKFQNKEVQIFTANIIAGGTGLNLQNASTVFIIDEDWTPSINMQAEDRVHRKGQSNPCTIYYPMVKDTIDERIAKVNQEKRSIINKII